MGCSACTAVPNYTGCDLDRFTECALRVVVSGRFDMATRKTGKDTPPAEPEIREEITESDQALPGTAADRGRPSRPNRGHQPPADDAAEEEGSISNRGDEYMKEDEQ